MQTQDDRSGGSSPSTADLADAGSGSRREGDDSGDARAEANSGMPPSDVNAAETEARRPLLGKEELDGFQGRWQAVQVQFVDEPRGSVKQADELVAELMQRLAQT